MSPLSRSFRHRLSADPPERRFAPPPSGGEYLGAALRRTYVVATLLLAAFWLPPAFAANYDYTDNWWVPANPAGA